MANDIQKSILSNPIKNGTVVVGCFVTGFNDKFTNNTSVSNNPTIDDIQDKYDGRFDEVSYYTLGNNTVLGG